MKSNCAGSPKPHLLALGEVLWDCLPSGELLGGAPCNAAVHAVQLGARAELLSRVGLDERGQRARAELQRRGVDTQSLQTDPALPTGTVEIEWESSGEPRYRIHQPVAWDRLAWEDSSAQRARKADAMLWGTLACRSAQSRSSIERYLLASRPDCVRLWDVNLRGQAWTAELLASHARLATALKVNAQELAPLADACAVQGASAVELLEGLSARYGWSFAVLTRGAQGSLLWAQGRVHELAAQTVEVVDPVGAGDAFGAALLVAHLSGMPWEAAHQHASECAARVCAHAGALPPLGSVAEP